MAKGPEPILSSEKGAVLHEKEDKMRIEVAIKEDYSEENVSKIRSYALGISQTEAPPGVVDFRCKFPPDRGGCSDRRRGKVFTLAAVGPDGNEQSKCP